METFISLIYSKCRKTFALSGDQSPNGAKKSPTGFTLIEVLLVVIILGVLAAIVLPRFIVGTSDAKSKACNTNIHNINTQWELKNIKTGDYGTLSALLSDTDYFPDGPPECPFEVAYADTNPANNRVDYSGTHDQHPGW